MKKFLLMAALLAMFQANAYAQRYISETETDVELKISIDIMVQAIFNRISDEDRLLPYDERVEAIYQYMRENQDSFYRIDAVRTDDRLEQVLMVNNLKNDCIGYWQAWAYHYREGGIDISWFPTVTHKIGPVCNRLQYADDVCLAAAPYDRSNTYIYREHELLAQPLQDLYNEAVLNNLSCLYNELVPE